MRRNKLLRNSTEIVKVISLLEVLLFYPAILAFSTNSPISITVEPSEIGVGEVFEVTVFVTGGDVGGLEFIPVDGIRIDPKPVYSGSSTQVKIIMGRTQIINTREWRYSGIAEKEGEFSLSVKVKVDNNEYVSEPVLIKVSKNTSSSKQSVPTPQYQRRQSQRRGFPSSPVKPHFETSLLDKALILESEVTKKLIYQGEIIYLTLRAKVFDSPDFNIRTSTGNLPDLPELDNFFVGKVEQFSKADVIDNYSYKVIELKVPICPKGVGTFSIPSWVWNASLNYYGGWGWPESYPIQKDTPPISIEVRPLPTPPPNFYGAVGSFTITSNLSATDVEVGTPLYLTLTISGEGYPEFIKPPELGPLEWGYVTGPEIVSVRSDSWTAVEKSFKYTISPMKEGEFQINSIEYSFFNPRLGQYATMNTPPFKVRVKRSPGNTVITAGGTPKLETQNLNVVHPELLPLITEGVKLRPSKRFKGGLQIIFFLAPPLFSSMLFFMGKRREILLNNPVLLRKKNAYKNAIMRYEEARKTSHTILAVENVLKQYIADVLGIENPLGMTSDEIAEALSKAVNDLDTVEKVRRTLKTCERIRYAGVKDASQAQQVGVENAFMEILETLRKDFR
ncbi:MAG: BatD family protein [Candidatus Hydrogenedentes bacterium]|nr:BatD family protein [Candidatus Hydrogenedentota bacterium]